jgi:antirestriction protein ArdC
MKNKPNNPAGKITARQKYNEVVDDFIKKLENNQTQPWTKSWSLSHKLPSNFVSNNQYSGMNILTLLSKGHKDSRWLTFNQISQMGGKVKKGAKSTPIFFMKPIEKEVTDDKSGELKTEKFFMMQSYNVFNMEQTEDIAYKKEEERTPDQNIHNFIETIGIDEFRGEPAYSPENDCIFMPHSHDFENSDEFHSTYFHELSHATGHKSRLDRHGKNVVYGDEKYAFEELIAELGSVFLSIEHNIKPNSKKQASYLSHWITALKERPQILYSAASYATKSTTYLQDLYKVKSMTKVQNFSLDVDLTKSKYQVQKQPNSNSNSKSHSPQAS